MTRQPYASTLRLEREPPCKIREKLDADRKAHLEADGQDEKVAGRVQRKIGQVEKVFGE